MRDMTRFFIAVIMLVSLSIAWPVVSATKESTIQRSEVAKKLNRLQTIGQSIDDIKPPKIEQPQWYKDQLAAEQAAREAARQSPVSSGGGRVVTYTLATKGVTRSNLAEFSAQANQTLNSPRGWAQLGFSFKQVPSGGEFNLILSEASQVPTFSPGCSAEWSCRVGVSVIINDDRWAGGTVAWNGAGGGIRDYRHMVINHEVGHWLGHGHASCPAPGAYAPVMLQQSIDLQGCKFNAWPLTSELWSAR